MLEFWHSVLSIVCFFNWIPQEMNIIKNIRVLAPHHSMQALPRDENLPDAPVSKPTTTKNMDNASVETVGHEVSAPSDSGDSSMVQNNLQFNLA